MVEKQQGEIKITLNEKQGGAISFAAMGLQDNDLQLDGGRLRLVLDMSNLPSIDLYQVPTIEIAYHENQPDTHWQCEFNGKTILDKVDHGGQSTVLLLNRKIMEDLFQHHENKLVLHAEFKQSTVLNTDDSYVHLLK